MPTKAPMKADETKKKRLRLAENSTTFKLAELKKKKQKQEIEELLHEAQTLLPKVEAAKPAEVRLKEIRLKLFEYAVDNDTNGFRDDRIAFQYSGMQKRSMLSSTKLLEHGVSLETINACYVDSDEWPDVKFVLFDTPPRR